MTEKHRFKTVIEQARGPGAAVALVPAAVATALGGLNQMRVLGSLKGNAFKTSTFPWRGTELYVGVPKAARKAAGVDVGDRVELEIERDDSPRKVELAPELKQAFKSEPVLKKRFDALSFSRQRLIAEPISEARKPETRAARLEKAIATLRAGPT